MPLQRPFLTRHNIRHSRQGELLVIILRFYNVLYSRLVVQFVRFLTRDNLQQENYRRSMANMLKRDWKIGDVYAPHDLSSAEMRKWSKKKRPDRDVFDILNVDPLSLYKVCLFSPGCDYS